jgi:hypothetical protein
MERLIFDATKGRASRATVILYYGLMLVALVVGLYGLFSLYWLAAGAFERSVYNPGSLF